MTETLNFIDQENVEEVIRERKDQYWTVLEAVKEGIIFSDETGHFWVFNSEMEKLTGYSMDEVNACPDFTLLLYPDPKDREQALDGLNNLIKPGDTYETETIIQTKNETKRNILVTTTLVLYKDRRMFLSTYHDITKRKQAEEEIKYLKEYNENILESNPNPIIVVKGNQIEYANKSFICIFGKTKNDYISKNLNEVISSEIIPAFEELLQNNDAIKELKIDRKSFSASSFIVKKAEAEEEEEVRRGIILYDITERKKAEGALKESEEKWHSVLENAPNVIMTLDQNGTILFINHTVAGVTPDKVIGKSHYDYIQPEHIKVVKETIEHVFKTDTPGKYVVQGTGHNSTISWYETHVGPVKQYGKTVAVTLIITDITERKNTEEKIKKSENRFRELADLLPETIFETDIQGNITFVNKVAFECFGYNEEDLNKGLNALEMIIPEERDKAKENIGQVMRGEKLGNIEYTAQRKDGSTIPVIIHSVPIVRDNKLVGLRGVIVDITEHKRVEDVLQESAKRYRELIEGSHDGYLMTDMDDKIVECNSIFKKITGYTDEELHKKTHNDITPEEWHPMEAKIVEEYVLKKGYSEVYEKELIGKDGRLVPVELRRYLLKEKGKPVGMWSFVRDITSRKQTDDELMKKINALERYKNITVGRELRLIELKKEVNNLCNKLGEKPKYKIEDGKNKEN